MYKYLITIVLALISTINVSTNAETIQVPSEQPTIQAGIDAAVDGDTVLVADGVYMGDGNRDIDFEGKAIVVISANGPVFTIINSEGSALDNHRGFYFHNNEDTNSVVSGFTITNGYSNFLPGGAGILCELASPKIEDCLFKNNLSFIGSGICLRESNAIVRKSTFIEVYAGVNMISIVSASPLIEYCMIDGWYSENLVFCLEANPKFKKNIFFANVITEWSECIVDEIGKRGNFIGNPYYCRDSSSLQERSACLPKNNNCNKLIGALKFGCVDCDLITMTFPFEPTISKPLFDTIKIPLSITNQQTVTIEPSTATWENDTLYFTLDSVCQYRYTVAAFSDCDTSYSYFTVNARIPKILHVPEEYSKIQNAINASFEYDTVLVGDGIYKGKGNIGFRLRHNNFVLMSINGPEQTIIDCQDEEDDGRLRRGLHLFGNDSTVIVDGFTIQNGFHQKGAGIYCSKGSPIIRNCILRKNNAGYDIKRGGGLYCSESSPTLIDCQIINNTANSGGGVFAIYSTPKFINCEIANNGTTFGGGGVYCWNSFPLFENCTIANNYSEWKGVGVYIDETSNAYFENSIISFNGNGGSLYNYWSDSIPTFSCTNIFGNEGGDWVGDISDQENINGNFSLDPEFCDTIVSDYSLKSSSPCAPDNNSCGELIGALEVECVQTDVEESIDLLPKEYALSQNYPNPFNPNTTIEFNLPKKSIVVVTIYNLIGQQVQQLVNQEYSAGNYKVTWDGITSNGVQTSTGIYFYRIETDSFVETKKMLLLK